MASAALKLQDDPLHKAGVADGIQPPAAAAPAWASAPIADAGAHPAAGGPAWASAPIADEKTHRAISRPEAFARGAVDAATVGGGDEIAQTAADIGQIPDRMGRAGAEILHNLVDPKHPITVPQPVRNTVGATMRGDLAASEEQHPVSALAGNIVGSLAPISRVAAAVDAAKFGTGIAGRVLASSLAGGATAGVYGFNSTDGDLGARAKGAADAIPAGLGTGAAFGAGAQFINPIANSFGRAATSAGRKLFPELLGQARPITTLSSAASGDAGGGMAGRYPTGETPIPDRAQESTINELAKLAGRKGLSPDDLDTKLNDYAADPRGRVAAELFGNQGTTRLKTLAELPGKTSDVLSDRLHERFRNQTTRLTKALDTAAGPKELNDALTDSAQQFEDASKSLYQPVLAAPMAPDAAGKVQGIIDRLPPELKALTEDSMQRVTTMRGEPQATTNTGEFHNYYRALGGAIRSLQRSPTLGAKTFTNDDLSAMKYLRGQFGQAMDEGAPGYQAARTQWRGISDAQEAAEQGSKLFSMNPDEATQYVQSLGPAEKQFFTAGAKTAIRQKLESGDKSGSEGARNVADQFLSTNQGKRLMAALGDQAPQFQKSLQSEDQAYRAARGMMPGQGSQTFRLFQDLSDFEPPTTPHGLVKSAARVASKYTIDPLREAARNRQGAALATPVDPGLKDFSLEERERLRMLVRQALQRKRGYTAASVGEGVDAGIGGSRDKKDQ